MNSVRLLRTKREIDALVARLIEREPASARLKKVMRYATSGGKRVRALLLVECAALFGVPRKRALLLGAVLECLHAYSLVHDDLPAIDNSDTRRGKPSTHKAFDEAAAILAGDALLTLAFEILTRPTVHPDSSVRAELINELSKAAGAGGMVGGQMLDLELEGRYKKQRPTLQKIRTMQQLKTAALFAFACKAGAILGGASKKHRRALENFGRSFGEAFQIADDLADAKVDRDNGKVTLVTFAGENKARSEFRRLVQEAENELKQFGKKAEILTSILPFPL